MHSNRSYPEEGKARNVPPILPELGANVSDAWHVLPTAGLKLARMEYRPRGSGARSILQWRIGVREKGRGLFKRWRANRSAYLSFAAIKLDRCAPTCSGSNGKVYIYHHGCRNMHSTANAINGVVLTTTEGDLAGTNES